MSDFGKLQSCKDPSNGLKQRDGGEGGTTTHCGASLRKVLPSTSTVFLHSAVVKCEQEDNEPEGGNRG